MEKGRGLGDEGFYFTVTRRLKTTERSVMWDDLSTVGL